MTRISLWLVLGVVVVGGGTGAVAEPDRPKRGDYVVFCSPGDSDYYQAARKLRDARPDKLGVQPFDPEKPEAALPLLRRFEPRYVVFVLRPEQIHVNSVRRILKMATKVDDDPFVDFEYGFITGATGMEAIRFVENIIKAPTKKHAPRVGRGAVTGGSWPARAHDTEFRSGALVRPMREIYFKPKDEHGRDQDFIDEHLPSFEGCGAIIMGGHGMPWEVVSGPRAEDVDKLNLFPSIAFNYACHTGVTLKYPEREYQAGEFVNRIKEVDAKKSFALAMIRTGVVGYTAYVNPRPAGPEMSIDFARALAGETLGAIRRNDYDKITMGYLGFGEPGITVPDVVDGERKARSEVDAVRHMMLEGATGGVLYGDPSYQAYEVSDDVLPLRTKVMRDGKTLRIAISLQGRYTYLWGADPFRRFDEKTRTMAMKLYDRVELPDEFEVKDVRITSAKWGGKDIETLEPVWAIEQDRGKRYLHVKANFARGGSGDVVVTFAAGTEVAPPAPVTAGAKTEQAAPGSYLDYALQVGRHIRTAETGKGDVYTGDAGIALFFFDLYAATNDASWRTLADARIRAARKTFRDEPGLYTGLAGVGQVYLDAWRSTKDEAYLKAAEDCARHLGEPKAHDVISGAAGVGIFLLNLHAATENDAYVTRATALGQSLLTHAVVGDEHVSWPVAPGSDRTYIGFSHGAAGIGYFLLHLHLRTKDDAYLELAKKAAVFVERTAVDDGKGGWQWTKMHPPRKPGDFRVQWCHGSPGNALLFMALNDHLEDGKEGPYVEALWKCISANLRDGRTARVSGCQCHGISGNAELFIDQYRRTKNPAMLAIAKRFAEDLVQNGKVKTAIGAHAYDPGYMTGLAGIGRFLLRLHDPERFDTAFMVK